MRNAGAFFILALDRTATAGAPTTRAEIIAAMVALAGGITDDPSCGMKRGSAIHNIRHRVQPRSVCLSPTLRFLHITGTTAAAPASWPSIDFAIRNATCGYQNPHSPDNALNFGAACAIQI